jgi:hypothetical protein
MDKTRNLKCSARAELIYGSRKFGAFKGNVPRNEILHSWYTNRGLFLKPTMKWDKNPNFEFKITGRLDSDFAKDLERH